MVTASSVDTGSIPSAMPACHVALAPLRESGHRLLMRALAAGGNRGQAVIAYDRCRRLLREQVGVAPSAETERLFRALIGRELTSKERALVERTVGAVEAE